MRSLQVVGTACWAATQYEYGPRSSGGAAVYALRSLGCGLAAPRVSLLLSYHPRSAEGCAWVRRRGPVFRTHFGGGPGFRRHAGPAPAAQQPANPAAQLLHFLPVLFLLLFTFMQMPSQPV